ncbi:Coenzyme F420 hydrogenase/dehydrogenase, beta subunit C-terminal domain [Marinisporobacter balticus]|nr:Coenzyme F420 hydrogenase/dehydrogenase, beta subunit C-terminal domain [Marinisporobacter balticus]
MINIQSEICNGCAACSNICPVDAIKMDYDQEGFLYPFFDSTICIKCEQCLKVCPVINEQKEQKTSRLRTFAAWSNNNEIRLLSTSGGIFSELALKVLQKGGCVSGAKYTKGFVVKHDLINIESELHQLMQSKYVQSEIGYIYRLIKKKLEEDRWVLFVGTPCQVVGLSNYLTKKYDNLILVDFICRGVNSGKAFKCYLESLMNEYDSEIKRVWFKNKKNGWNKFGTKIDFLNGEYYFADRYKDPFMVGYLKHNLYMRPSCHQCKFKSVERNSDITLADYWGVKLRDESLDIEKGTSLIIAHSEKALKIIDEIKSNIYLEESSLEEAITNNLCAIESTKAGQYRNYFFEKVKETDFLDLINKITDMEAKQ